MFFSFVNSLYGSWTKLDPEPEKRSGRDPDPQPFLSSPIRLLFFPSFTTTTASRQGQIHLSAEKLPNTFPE